MSARFGDHHSAVGVAHQHDRAILGGNRCFGRSDVLVKRFRRILDYGDVEASLLEFSLNAFPSRAVHETAVDQHYVAHVPIVIHHIALSQAIVRRIEVGD